MAKLAVVQGAILKCDKGATPSPLSVTTPSTTQIEYAPVATIMDYLPGANIKPFGVCAITGVPCVPVTPIPWFPGEPSIALVPSIFPILSSVSVLPCAVGGIIQILSAGQTTVIIDSPAAQSVNQAQNKKRRAIDPAANLDKKDDAGDPSLYEKLKNLDGKEFVIPIPEFDLPKASHGVPDYGQKPPVTAKPLLPEHIAANEEIERRSRMRFPNSPYTKMKEAEDREYKENAENTLDAAKKLLSDAIKIGSKRRIIEAEAEVKRAQEQTGRAAQGRQPLRGAPPKRGGK